MMKFIQNKRNILLLVIGIILLLLLIFSGTYAYMTMRPSDETGRTDVNIGSGVQPDMGTVEFISGTTLSLTPGSHNVVVDGGNISSTTNPSVTLTPVGGPEALAGYKSYINITNNEFIYTTGDDTKTEVLLKVTAPTYTNEGVLTETAITEIDGLRYDSALGGFDITGKVGLFFFGDYAVQASNSLPATVEWNITIEFVNLDTNQNANKNKALDAEIIMQQKGFASDVILMNNGGKAYIDGRDTPDFSQIANTDEGIFAAPDDYGTSYYFRGAVDDNWVLFGGIYWRIIRINGDNTIRLLYAGTTEPTYAERISRSASIANVFYGPTISENRAVNTEHAGYMYSINDPHGLSQDSVLKSTIDNWFGTSDINLISQTFLNDTLFCNDRNFSAGTGIGTSGTIFNTYNRLILNKEPTLFCENKNDRFTVEDETMGNSALTYPVATITADELMFAGNTNVSNSSNYLNGNNYWTMSPYSNSTYIYVFYNNNSIIKNYITYSLNSSLVLYGTKLDTRPVINLKPDTMFTGSGTYNDVYKVVGDTTAP